MRNRRVKSWTNSSFKTREFPERHLRTLVSLMAHRLNLNRGAFFPYYYYYYYYSFVFFLIVRDRSKIFRKFVHDYCWVILQRLGLYVEYLGLRSSVEE